MPCGQKNCTKFLRVTELFEIQEEDYQQEQEIFIEVTGTHIGAFNA